MNSLALATFLRSLARHRLYALLNIGGLALGIAVFIVLALYVRFETGFEHWLPGHDRTWLVETRWTLEGNPFSGTYPNTMGGLLEELRADFPGVVGARIRQVGANVIRGGVGTSEDMVQADANLLDIVALPIARGRAAGALAVPSNVLVSESMARKYFGDADPVGRPLTLDVEGRKSIYRVAAVFADLPKATELPKIAMIGRLPLNPEPEHWYHWGSSSLFTYLRLDDAAAARALEARLDAFVDRRALKDSGPHASRVESLRILPIADLHLQKPATRLTVATLGLVGLLTLLIAIVNYVNLATARAALRAREVAMRKVLGADHAILVRQFVGEAIATASLATVIGLSLAELALPVINAAAGTSLKLVYLGHGGLLPPLALLILVVGVAAGLYPALLLARFPAAAVLASARAPGGGRSGARVREGLVIFQFALATAFLIGTLVLVTQIGHVRRTDLGFRREGLVVVRSLADSALSDGQRRAILDAFRAVPGVQVAGLSNNAVGNNDENDNESVKIPGRPGDGPSVKYVATGAGFFTAYGIRPIAGRLFDMAHGADDTARHKKGERRSVVINARAVPVLGFRSPADAVGKSVGDDGKLAIIGVVPDARFFSPRDPIAPTYYEYTSGMPIGNPLASVRFEGDPRAVTDALAATWRRLAPEVPFDARLATQSLARYYADDDHAARLFAIGAGLAVLIGCVGLWGLASFNTARRVKEIGIRKTLGASSADIVRLLVGQFLRPVLIANLFAWPLAFFAMRTWLAGFDDRIALSPLFFAAATLLALGIAVLTVVTQSLRAARAAPAWALRHE